jgi:hypothetical protein
MIKKIRNLGTSLLKRSRILFNQILVTFEISHLASHFESKKSIVLGLQKVVFGGPRQGYGRG